MIGDFFNPLANREKAGSLYVLDRRAWDNRTPSFGERRECYSDLMSIITETFKNTPNLYRVVVSNKDFQDFKIDLEKYKPYVVAIYKHPQDANIKEYSDYDLFSLITTARTSYPNFYIFVKSPLSFNITPEKEKKISQYWFQIESGIFRTPKLKDYVISYLTKINEVMLIANDISIYPQHYKGQIRKVHSFDELQSYQKLKAK